MVFQDDMAQSANLPPLSPQELRDKAVNFDYNSLIPLRYWLRTADTLSKESNIYISEGNLQQGYMLLMRQAELVLQYIPKHPDARIPENSINVRKATARCSQALQKLEELRPQIQARYDAYRNARPARESDSGHYEKSSSYRRPSPSEYQPQPQQKSSSSGGGRTRRAPKPLDLSRRMSSSSLTGGPFSPPLERSMSTNSNKGNFSAGDGSYERHERRSLALEIAKQEFEKRERSKRERRMQEALKSNGGVPVDSSGYEIRRISTPTPPYPHSQGRNSYYSSRSRGGPPGETDEQRLMREAEEEEADLYRSLEKLNLSKQQQLRALGQTPRERMPPPRRPSPDRRSRGPDISYIDVSGFPDSFHERERPVEKHVGSWKGSYPTVPKRTYSPTKLGASPYYYPPPVSSSRITTPNLPPKRTLDYDGPPPLPAKAGVTDVPHSPYGYWSDTSPISPALPPKPPKEIEAPPQPKPDFGVSASLENGQPLRTIFLPAGLRTEFLRYAEPNTRRNFETCGILCGTLIQNAFFISRLVIPEQEATSDTCAMKDEEGLFDYCDKEDLMVLGWIHTHPTQTCFMSSVDLHTHSGYQWQLRESIAIVCAPSKSPSWGVFRLTDPPGVQVISECTERGLFHPHVRDDVYTDALRPGHVCELKDMGFEVVDLRDASRKRRS